MRNRSRNRLWFGRNGNTNGNSPSEAKEPAGHKWLPCRSFASRDGRIRRVVRPRTVRFECAQSGRERGGREERASTGDPLTPKPRANGEGRAERTREPRSGERVSSTPFRSGTRSGTTTCSIYAVFWASVSYLRAAGWPGSSTKLTTRLTTHAPALRIQGCGIGDSRCCVYTPGGAHTNDSSKPRQTPINGPS